MVYVYFSVVKTNNSLYIHVQISMHEHVAMQQFLVDDVCTFDFFSSLANSYYDYKIDSSINIGT
jgi:hypothetical protein